MSKNIFGYCLFPIAVLTFASGLLGQSTPTGIYERVVIRDDVGPAGARAFASPFDAVVGLTFGGGQFCTGVLVAPNIVLSARHCDVFVGDDVVFGNDLNNPTFTAKVISVFNPAGSGSLLDGGDFSILTLNQNISGAIATPMKLSDETSFLVGKLAALIGYGYNGVGSTGHGNTADDFRWGGTNIIDRYGTPAGGFTGANIFSTDFDDGTAANNTIPGSDPNPTDFEATTAPGDSGGPLLVRINNEWVVVGVLSGGTTFNSVYGDISWWTGVAPFRSHIEAVGGVFVAIPEPGSLVIVLIIGAAMVGRSRWNRGGRLTSNP